jgi:hypothetical protein
MILRPETGEMTSQRKAILCLAAVAMLYTPVISAAVAACLMPCCTSNQCEITSHHHAPAKPAPRHDCAQSDSAQADCTMRSCSADRQQATASHVFVLPTGVTFVGSMPLPQEPPRVSTAVPQTAPEPLSPPPRPSLA